MKKMSEGGRTLRIEQLEYLLEVAKSQSINKSSEKLHITHQSLNTAIKNLEKELDIVIFERTFQGVTLTDVGKEAVKIVQEIVDRCADLRCLAQNNKQNEASLHGELSIYAAPFLGLTLNPMVTKKFLQTYPHVQLKMKSKETNDILKNLSTDLADLYFVVTFDRGKLPISYDYQQFVYHEVLQDKLVLLTSIEHPLSKNKTLSLTTILKYPLALFQASENSPNIIFDIMPSNSKPKINLVTDHLETYREIIASGKSVALVPHFSVVNNPYFKDHPQLTFIPVKNIPLVAMGYIVHKETDYKKRDLINAFVTVLNDCIG